MNQEEINHHYNSAMDSVNLILNGKDEDTTQEEWNEIVDRNKRHLEIMVSKDFMINSDKDLQPFHDAINSVNG
mgnify:CR=1 FL=1